MTEAAPGQSAPTVLVVGASRGIGREFVRQYAADGWRVAYGRLDDPDTSRSICGELMRRHSEFDAEGVVSTECGEWRLRRNDPLRSRRANARHGRYFPRSQAGLLR